MVSRYSTQYCTMDPGTAHSTVLWVRVQHTVLYCGVQVQHIVLYCGVQVQHTVLYCGSRYSTHYCTVSLGTANITVLGPGTAYITVMWGPSTAHSTVPWGPGTAQMTVLWVQVQHTQTLPWEVTGSLGCGLVFTR
jgi:hypothetical protein